MISDEPDFPRQLRHLSHTMTHADTATEPRIPSRARGGTIGGFMADIHRSLGLHLPRCG
jgi:hypothetical protein